MKMCNPRYEMVQVFLELCVVYKSPVRLAHCYVQLFLQTEVKIGVNILNVAKLHAQIKLQHCTPFFCLVGGD